MTSWADITGYKFAFWLFQGAIHVFFLQSGGYVSEFKQQVRNRIYQCIIRGVGILRARDRKNGYRHEPDRLV